MRLARTRGVDGREHDDLQRGGDTGESAGLAAVVGEVVAELVADDERSLCGEEARVARTGRRGFYVASRER